MRIEADTQIYLVALDSMVGLSIGLKYFDDATVIYVSPEVHHKFLLHTLGSLDFVTLKYRSNEKHIEDVVKEIVYELNRCPEGSVTSDVFNEMHIQHHKHQVSIDLEHSDGQGLPMEQIIIDI